eukprot:SAG31_NODE_37537_length_303_cov_1.000000_1_plen_33_part_10
MNYTTSLLNKSSLVRRVTGHRSPVVVTGRLGIT